jgi:hypothetical protein
MTAPSKLMPVSFSRLSTFENCQAQFDYMYVSKSVQNKDNEFSLYGTRVHESLENYARGVTPDVTDEAKLWKPLVDKILAQKGDKYFEFEMAITRSKTPCGWSDEGVWIRSIADVLVVNGQKAYCIDWKTGKPKDNPTQLQLFAAMVFHHFPGVDEVRTSFVWLNHNKTTDVVYKRAMLPHIWLALEPRFDKLQEVVDLGVFKAKPSGLCRWCSAMAICPSARV